MRALALAAMPLALASCATAPLTLPSTVDPIRLTMPEDPALPPAMPLPTQRPELIPIDTPAIAAGVGLPWQAPSLPAVSMAIAEPPPSPPFPAALVAIGLVAAGTVIPIGWRRKKRAR